MVVVYGLLASKAIFRLEHTVLIPIQSGNDYDDDDDEDDDDGKRRGKRDRK